MVFRQVACTPMIRGPGRALYVVTTGLVVHRFDGTRFIGTHPNTGASTWSGFQQAPLVDRQGEWWIPTDNGLYRFARVSRIEELARARPAAVYGAAHGLPGTGINNPFEDARGDIWFGVMGFSVVARWERRTDRISVFGEEHGIPRAGPAMNFTEARNGEYLGWGSIVGQRPGSAGDASSLFRCRFRLALGANRHTSFRSTRPSLAWLAGCGSGLPRSSRAAEPV